MRVPILVYHAVLPLASGAEVRGTVALREFRRQLGWLARRGYTAIDLDRAAEVLGGGVSVERPLVITFDDGYRCVVEHALPMLQEWGFTATLFVVTSVVGGTTDWYSRRGGPSFAHATWDELAHAKELGFHVESHGVRHARLTRLGSDELAEELCGSRDEIRRRLGGCAHFAYPFGACNASIADEVERCGYRTACTTRSGPNAAGQSLTLLRRQTVSRGTRAWRFRRKVGAWW